MTGSGKLRCRNERPVLGRELPVGIRWLGFPGLRPVVTPLRRSRTAGFGHPTWPSANELSVRKPQLPLDRLEARLLAQRIKKGICFHPLQLSFVQTQCCLEPVQCSGCVTPLGVGHGVFVSPIVTSCSPQFG